MLWRPECGHIPRGYTGATNTVQDVQLVICLAEPGNPLKTESYPVSDADQFVWTVAAAVAAAIENGGRGFHGNLKYVLNACWPGLTLIDQLKRTWITEATLCSAETSTGPIRRQIEAECTSRYLKKQIALFPGAFILALGSKAANRLRSAEIPFHYAARAVGRPIGIRVEAEQSWQAAGVAFRKRLNESKGV